MHKITSAIRKGILIVATGTLLNLSFSSQALANTDSLDLEQLFDLDIQQLMDIEVTLSSRNQERQFSTPAASYVITREDIRRSGLRSIPELLRLVPGVHVGKIDANKWGINIRDNTNQFSGSMLVLMDGRTLYNPLFAGTRWEAQDYILEDIERIEVIRGPGGAAWGANAVNGIINIVTRTAHDTQGTLVFAGGGRGEVRTDLGFRHGLETGDKVHLRVYEKTRRTDRGEYLDNLVSNNDDDFPVGSDAFDDGRLNQTGFRLDWDIDKQNAFTLQGDYYKGRLHDIRHLSFGVIPNEVNISGSNLLSRWNHRLNDNSSISLQAYLDSTERKDSSFEEEYTTADIDFQHDFTLASHAITWAVGARRTSDDTYNPSVFALSPASRTDRLYSAFVQDRWQAIENQLWLTLGLKEENNDFTGNEYQPSVKLAWTPDTKNTWWASFSKVVRTPSRGDHNAILDFGGGTTIAIGDPALESKQVKTSEIGYRSVISSHSLLDISLFYNHIDDKNVDPTAPREHHAKGIEINTHHEINNDWKIEFWIVSHQLYNEDPTTGIVAEDKQIADPSAHFRSYWNINSRWQLDMLLYYNDEEMHNSNTVTIESYTRVDFHIGWNPSTNLSVDMTLSNMLDDVHGEAREGTRINTGVNRGFYARLAYRF